MFKRRSQSNTPKSERTLRAMSALAITPAAPHAWPALRAAMEAIVRLCPEAANVVLFVVDFFLSREMKAKLCVLVREAEHVARGLLLSAAREAGAIEPLAKTKPKSPREKRARPAYDGGDTSTWRASFALAAQQRSASNNWRRNGNRLKELQRDYMVARTREERFALSLRMYRINWPNPYGVGRRLHALQRILKDPAAAILRARRAIARWPSQVLSWIAPRAPKPPPEPKPRPMIGWQPLLPPREPDTS